MASIFTTWTQLLCWLGIALVGLVCGLHSLRGVNARTHDDAMFLVDSISILVVIISGGFAAFCLGIAVVRLFS